MGGLLDGLHRALDQVVLQDDLDLHLGQEIDDVLGAAVERGVAFLAAEALGLGHRDALDADLVQGFLHLVQLERLDDRFDLLHRVYGPRISAGVGGTAPTGSVLAACVRNRSLRSEEHTSELQSLMRTSYAVFCLKKIINTY